LGGAESKGRKLFSVDRIFCETGSWCLDGDQSGTTKKIRTDSKMPEQVNTKTVYSLLEITRGIQKTLEESFRGAYWIKAEMNKLNLYTQSGHCYPELVEKEEGKVIAQIKSTLWKNDYIAINNTFLSVLKEPLKDGIKILFLAKISFDPVYGLSLRILDIDPSYTLGDLERDKQETIRRLQVEGIIAKNKSLRLPLLPQRIAIISAETSKGYADFLEVLDSNPWKYKYFHVLFPSLLQGEKAVESISGQLNRIRKVQNHFDVVAIIRGGGGDIGLSCYNDYHLAKEIALFPVPVITGIGHATNETVVEMTSFRNEITPTKLAEYLIQKFHEFSVPVQKALEQILSRSGRMVREEKTKLHSVLKMFRLVTGNVIVQNRNEIKDRVAQQLSKASKSLLLRGHEQISLSRNVFSEKSLMLLQTKRLELNNSEKNVQNMSPENVLKRGYSITLHQGKALRSPDRLNEGDTLKTVVFKGSIISIVKSKSNDHE
jgi:exodeoxyribonuclease VII large subunit